MKGIKYEDDYAGCLSFALKDGIKRKQKPAEDKKREQEEKINRQKKEILEKYPELNNILKEIKQLYINKTKLFISDKNSLEIKELDKKIDVLEVKMNDFISKYNIPSNLF